MRFSTLVLSVAAAAAVGDAFSLKGVGQTFLGKGENGAAGDEDSGAVGVYDNSLDGLIEHGLKEYDSTPRSSIKDLFHHDADDADYDSALLDDKPDEPGHPPRRPDRPHFPFPGKPPGHPKPPKKPKFPHPKPPHHGRPSHPHKFNLTLYEMIKKSNYTSKFAELVGKDEKLKELLSDTSKNYTLLVPVNRAFGAPPHWPRRPPHFAKDQQPAILRYHILEGIHCSKELKNVRTLETIIENDNLGKDQKQRLRFSTHFGSPHVHINIVSTVFMTDIFGTNGVVHGISHILLPPPPALSLISLFPNQFSTTLYAITKLGLEDTINDLAGKGLTFFPPTNKAWQRLPWDITTFLFSKHGVKHLEALIKYHVAPKATLYSDALVKPEPAEDSKGGSGLKGHFHTDLETLLEGKKISVDIKKWWLGYGWKLNASRKVTLQDLLVEDGVIQIPSGVLIPPCEKPGGEKDYEDITVEDLAERLGVALKEEDEQK